MKIIPAIDLLDGNVVRLSKGDYNNKVVYSQNPLEVVKTFEDAGFSHIHIIDLAGSKDARITTLSTLEKIKSETNTSIQFGGGIRKAEDIKVLLDTGIDKIILGSVIYKYPKEFSQIILENDAGKLIAASDILNRRVKISGWLEDAGAAVEEHIEGCLKHGIVEFLITDISRDGMLKGPNFGLYNQLQLMYPDIKIIVSGGISGATDLARLNEKKYYGVVIGKAYYDSKITLEEMISYAG